MLKSLRKFLNEEIGLPTLSKEKAKEIIDELVAKGEVTIEEGKKLYAELASKVDEKKDNANAYIKQQIMETLTNMGVPDKSRIDAIEKRIEALERQLAENNESKNCDSEKYW